MLITYKTLLIGRCRCFAVVAALLSMGTVSLTSAYGAPSRYDPETPTLKASQLAPKTTLKGPNHTVQEKVVNRGFMNHYRITSPFGEFSAAGDTMLIVRVHEISAIAKLKEMSKTKVFAEAAGDTVGKTVGAIGKVIDDPKGTAQGISAGVSRLFKRTARKTQDAYDKVKDAAEKEEQEKQEGQAGGTSDTSSQLTEDGKRLGRRYLGVDSALRKLARDLNVNPYTDNAVLRAEMDSMAKVAAAGSFGTKLVTPSLPVGLDYLDDVSDLVWTMNPLDLQLLNEKSLQEMGVESALVKSFYDNEHHNPTTHTRIVKSLERLPGVKDRAVLVRYAAVVESPEEAQFTAHIVEMLADYHKTREPLDRVVATDRIPFAVTKKGTGIAAAAIDYLFWTQSAASAAQDLLTAMKRHTSQPAVWVEGRVSNRARTELRAMGWTVYDREFRLAKR